MVAMREIPDGMILRRFQRAVRDGQRLCVAPSTDIGETEAELRAAGLLASIPTVEDSYRILGRQHRVDSHDADSRDPDTPLLDPEYDIAAADRAWFPLRVRTLGGSLERTRRFIARRGFASYWPRSIRVVSRGNGARKHDVTLTRSAFGAYVLVHLTIGRDGRAPFGALTDEEGRFYGIGGFVEFGRGPVSMAPTLVDAVIAAEASGLYDHTKRKGNRRITEWPEHADVGRLVRIVDGPFTSFGGVVHEIDDERRRLKVLVSMFGRATSVDLDLSQIDAA